MKNHQETSKITSVLEMGNHFEIAQGMMCYIIEKSYGITPKVGDTLTVHRKHGVFGKVIGMDINEEQIFRLTDEQLNESRLEWLQNRSKEKQQNFKDNVASMDKRYSSLPKCFQERIDWFRSADDRFRIDYEEYELFCCEQAVAIANACKTIEGIKSFSNKGWADRMLEVPELSDGHSNNTFYISCDLACWYLCQLKDLIYRDISRCNDYRCPTAPFCRRNLQMSIDYKKGDTLVSVTDFKGREKVGLCDHFLNVDVV